MHVDGISRVAARAEWALWEGLGTIAVYSEDECA